MLASIPSTQLESENQSLGNPLRFPTPGNRSKEKIGSKFDKLLKEGRNILDSCGYNGSSYRKGVPSAIDYSRFITESLNLTRRSCGENSDHYKQIKRFAEDQKIATNSLYFKECYGFLEAAARDFNEEMLFDTAAVVTAEVLDDFLEQAEYLFSIGYHIPAASLSGAVLEDTLRKLSEVNAITVPDRAGIDKLNTELARKGVYNKLIWKCITVLADIRNSADHGHFDKFKKEDVDDMLK